MAKLKLPAIIVFIIAGGIAGSFLANTYIWQLDKDGQAADSIEEAQETKDKAPAPLSLIGIPPAETIETQSDEQISGVIQEIEEQIFAPLPPAKTLSLETPFQEIQQEEISPPLRVAEEAPTSLLTQAGVIQWTNIQREQQGLPALRENPKLNASAQEKIQDMFTGQYFAHQSPYGEGAKDLVKIFGYEFILIGENLALGNFRNDQILVQAWMDSPGHRANILNSRYQEIGVAVGRGIFNGQSTWLAVQHFALPLSACFQPDETLRAKIGENQNQIDEMLITIETLRTEMQTEIQTARPKRRLLTDRQKIEEYNILASQYNALAEETRNLVYQYNNQVKLFNECVAGVEQI